MVEAYADGLGVSGSNLARLFAGAAVESDFMAGASRAGRASNHFWLAQ